MASMTATGAVAGKNGKNVEKDVGGTSSGTTEIVAVIDANTFGTSSDGTLNSKHLGKSTYHIDAEQAWGGAGPACPGAPQVAVVTGSIVITAANGDTIEGEISGTTCEAGPSYDNDEYLSTLTVTIDGGTGRFVNATGTLLMTGTSTGTAPNFVDSGSMSGTVTY
jgi:hypothetical protein